ncbi:hypothetical protein SAMN05216304_10922 [Bosea sp. OK403]|uniref:hypothetical protein n=1 Tax=Bosea sp. OK403 TaxID=1855286 RepID=UPI0008EC10FA|nr:hypothetical protein [Bosea sp. OK403]SFJ51916.1 hypothetical protein SAMN05216304_10922 [Bosea sp. OK403]
MTKTSHRATDAPVPYSTPQRPGQSGEDAERRAGPNPRSVNPTGPHAPYDPADPEGTAAEKHWTEPESEPVKKPPAKPALGENFAVVDSREGKA